MKTPTPTPHKVIIAGSRHIENDAYSRELINDLILSYKNKFNATITHVITGKCAGVDTIGEEVAQSLDLEVIEYPADWSAHGYAAGPIRNRQMAANADGLILVWDGKSRGSYSMLSEARKAGLNITTHTDTGR
jgi:predicted Rossmann fold nucleotide-binding protein DprA/Smf involved in DNA uptake